MALTIVAMTQKEEFLEFLDPDLCDITETIDYQGLRTINFEYTFKDAVADKELFRQGNKIWIQGDRTLKDCLYVINTEVSESIYKDNNFVFEAEEVLVELNYAPLFSHLELTKKAKVGDAEVNIFNLSTTNGKQEVTVNWNALNYWFGDYFNIATVQKCISTYAGKISLTGTMTRMSLLRHIEEETGNIFITRYEKDPLNNTIHRYLDFLNPINIDQKWEFHTEYRFIDTNVTTVIYDEDGNETTEDPYWMNTPYWNSNYENLPETADLSGETIGTEGTYEYIKEAETVGAEKQYTPLTNITVANIAFRITTPDGLQLLADDDTPLYWKATDAGLSASDGDVVIRLVNKNNALGIDINKKSYVVQTANSTETESTGFIFPAADPEETLTTLVPDESYFEFYDFVNDKVIYRALINNRIGKVHQDVLDFGFNVEDVQYNVDESETYSAVSPVLSLNNNDGQGLSRTQLGNLISNWQNLKIDKGDIVPMIVEKVNVKASSLPAAINSLGTYNLSTNYYARPVNPQDNKDANSSSDYTWEFFKATAYWKAPYYKRKGRLHINSNKSKETQYRTIYHRNDTRDEKGPIQELKMGTSESSDENVYQIYNQLCQYMKEHETPRVDIQVDVANLKNGEYVEYDLHDKVYVKLPDSDELITARVTSTSKEAHDIAKNTITLSNYSSQDTVKTVTKSTFIEASNLSFKYPSTKALSVRLTNEDYNNQDPEDIEHLPLKLLTFAIYDATQGSRTFKKAYTRLTNGYGRTGMTLNLKPGNYEIDITFGGDELYSECSATIKVNVGGVIEKVAKMSKRTKADSLESKILNVNAEKMYGKMKGLVDAQTKYKTVDTYWTKCGLSPDKSKIISIAQPSAGDGNYSYNQLWKTEFKNKCPECGRVGTLRFDGLQYNKCITSSTYGVPYKPSVPEHEITCISCDSDYDGVTGLEKNYGHSTRLTRLTNPVKSSHAEFAKLCKGQLVYDTKKVEVKQTPKATVNGRVTRKYRGQIGKALRQKAEEIVGNKIGVAAAKEIANWMDNHIYYSKYYGFCRSVKKVLEMGTANCCDGTRTFFKLCDAAGCCEYLNFYYIYVVGPTGHIYGVVESKKTKKWTYVDPASDYHGCWGYVSQGYPHSRSPASTYPNIPFDCG